MRTLSRGGQTLAAAMLAATAGLAAGACGEDPGVDPRPGDWEGTEVRFHIEGGRVSGWRFERMFCEGETADGTRCIRHPRSSYPDDIALGRAGFTGRFGDFTLRATFETEIRASGTWKIDAADCCSGSGRWTADHVRDLPQPPRVDTGPDGVGTPDTVVPTDAGPLDRDVGPAPTGPIMASAETFCARWNQTRASLVEPEWTGSADTCAPGTIDAVGLNSTLELVNLYREMAGLPPVDHSPEMDARAQDCSLLMQANGTIDHFPPAEWRCFTDSGAQGARQSNLATTPSVRAVDLYIVDDGHPDTLGHRRWVLTHGTGPFGIGSASGFSCLHWPPSDGDAGVTWTAWPPAGYFPLQAVSGLWGNLDRAGWSFHSPVLSLAPARVSVTRDGESVPVQYHRLQPGYGKADGLRIVPDGWRLEAGRRYEVLIDGVSPSVLYTFEVVDCDRL